MTSSAREERGNGIQEPPGTEGIDPDSVHVRPVRTPDARVLLLPHMPSAERGYGVVTGAALPRPVSMKSRMDSTSSGLLFATYQS